MVLPSQDSAILYERVGRGGTEQTRDRRDTGASGIIRVGCTHSCCLEGGQEKCVNLGRFQDDCEPSLQT